MTETTDRCPLCGGRAEPITVRGLWLCEQCSLPADLWPRIAELVLNAGRWEHFMKRYACGAHARQVIEQTVDATRGEQID